MMLGEQPVESTAKKAASGFVQAVLVRVVLYGGGSLAVIGYLVGFAGLVPHGSAARTSSEANRPADRGWPHLRGPDYNAHQTGCELAESWPTEGPPVLWIAEIGRGYSGVIAVGNRVYAQGQTLTQQRVLALDADTGSVAWEHRYGWPYDPGGMYPGPRATPTWSDGRVYFAAPDGLVGCLRDEDGKLLWSINVNERFGGRGTDFGYSCSPLALQGKVILPVGGPEAAVVALDALRGSVVWTSGTAPASYCSALPITLRGRRQVVTFLQNELAGCDLETGRLLWRKFYSSGYDEHAAMPIYQEPLLRTMGAFRAGSDLFELEPSPDGTGCGLRLVRHDRQMSNDVASSVLVDGCVYGFDLRDVQTAPSRPSRGEFRCMDFATGAIRWSSDRPGHAGIAVADGKLLLLNDRGEVILLRANPTRYEELARAQVFREGLCWTAPSLAHDRLYLRGPTQAACLYVGKPERMSQHLRSRARRVSNVTGPAWIPLNSLVGAERECPFELPDLRELSAWYGFSMGAIGVSALIAAAVQGGLWRRNGPLARHAAVVLFWVAVPVLGLLATPVSNRYSSQFVLTWPVTLLASQQIALIAVFWARQPGRGNQARWIAAGGTGVLIAACLAYYELTRRLTMAPAWYFLATLVASWPLALPAAWRSSRRLSLLNDVLWLLATFSLYFAASAGVMLWRTSVSR